MATRERKEQFISEFGQFALAKAVEQIILREGADFLTDEQIDMITSKLVREERRRQHDNMRNRARRVA